MTSYAILIDGGFLKRKLGSPKEPATIEHIRQFLERLKQESPLPEMRLHRVYFYDAQPLSGTEKKPLGGEVIDFGSHPSVARNTQMHTELVREPYVALRLGELAFRGWRLSRRSLKNCEKDVAEIRGTDLSPEIQQKGVDMRIGLDIASLTLKKQADVIVLVTGDSDFVPAMKFARREGAQLFLVTLGHSIKDSMREHADLVLSVE